MKTVQFEYHDTESDAPQASVPDVVKFTNDTGKKPDKLSLKYESATPGTFYWKMLVALYGLASKSPVQIYRPDWFYIESDGSKERYDRSHSLVATAEQGRLKLAVVTYIDGWDVTPVDWRPEASSGLMTVDTEEFAQQLLSGAREYRRRHSDPDSGIDRFVSLLIDEIEERWPQGERDKSLTHSAADIPGSMIHTYLYDCLYPDDSFSYLLQYNGIIEAEIQRLQSDAADPDEVGTRYQTLLSHESKPVQRATALALRNNPDERANEWLLSRRWTDIPAVVVPSLEAAAEFPNDGVRDALIETISFSSHPEVRKTAVELLQPYSDNEALNALEKTAETDDDETVRESAQSVLDSIAPD
ncbi:HEAT repeat domain-containing protein [Haloarcula sp. CGMCC 1.6347]|uniref:HEAT repeat domain-containing protein n=1 Tax=Haloarcula sp. CGMCC 1.6347 TaxID=3111455 RepID=UPI00300F5978